MTRSRRLLCSLGAVLALVAAGCGSRSEGTSVADTEGVYITVDEMRYQVQLSRILNPADVEDQGYLRGMPTGVQPRSDEVWFAIFMRVENGSTQTHRATSDFEIHDTQENVFRPVPLDLDSNVFVYEPREIPAGELLPAVGSPAFNNPIRGGMLLFKLKTQSLYNRPLELKVASSEGGDEGTIDLDV